MKTNNTITAERLKQTVSNKSGCTPLYLRVLKSDLHNLLSKYMRFSDIDFSVMQLEKGYNLTVNVNVAEFLEIGRAEDK